MNIFHRFCKSRQKINLPSIRSHLKKPHVLFFLSCKLKQTVKLSKCNVNKLLTRLTETGRDVYFQKHPSIHFPKLILRTGCKGQLEPIPGYPSVPSSSQGTFRNNKVNIAKKSFQVWVIVIVWDVIPLVHYVLCAVKKIANWTCFVFCFVFLGFLSYWLSNAFCVCQSL